MKRSEINSLIRSAGRCFQFRSWTLPPSPRWDAADFGLVLVNLAEEPEYCEKLMYAQKGMTTLLSHAQKEKGGHHLPLGPACHQDLGGTCSKT